MFSSSLPLLLLLLLLVLNLGLAVAVPVARPNRDFSPVIIAGGRPALTPSVQRGIGAYQPHCSSWQETADNIEISFQGTLFGFPSDDPAPPIRFGVPTWRPWGR
ncbi:hypothetical protein E2C01_018221 [Portunus trituberculatus]|uniref:Uncharacterized protein n=1 Tax=Portunus trituberculatus TaxID=210409 RepID=A0A5B7DUG9_PORTR|nr:hypothetical protein [Portunus trituberculatus]